MFIHVYLSGKSDVIRFKTLVDRNYKIKLIN